MRTTVSGTNGTSPSTLSDSGTAETSFSHIVYTRDATGLVKLYKKGIEILSKVIDGDFSNWDNNYRLGLGDELKDERPWLGEFHLVSLYGRALSTEEVMLNFNAGFNN